MRVVVTEKWVYREYVYWDIDEFPDGWDDMSVDDKHSWVQDNGKYLDLDNEADSFIEVEDVEAR